ncbi:MAG: response regulator [Tenuifilaceae bacterium]
MSVTENKKILIVDDNHINRMLIKLLLKSYGYNSVSEASNGHEAIISIEGNEYSLVFMDIQMPVMDGIEATKYIRDNLNAEIPIIAITAYDCIEVEENGFNDLIRKPYNSEKIKAVLDRFMQ